MREENLINAISLIAEEKRISKDVIINSIKEGFIKSYEKQFPDSVFKIDINEDLGEINIYKGYKIVEDNSNLTDDSILLKNALLEDETVKIDDILYLKLDSNDVKRSIAIQVAQILRQQIREAEKKSIYQEYKDKINEIMTGKVVTIKENFYLLEVGRTFAFLPKKNALVNDKFDIDDSVKFYVENINELSKNSGQILASRTNKWFLKKLLEQEIPEIFEGVVKVKSIARDPGIRSKISVYSENENIDPVGTCVGIHGSRIKKIIEELNGENIDVCKWSDDREKNIRNVFSIVNILHIENISEKEITLIVAKNQLSLAIGKQGKTIKLCANLLNIKINVISDDDPKAIKIFEEIKQKEQELAAREAQLKLEQELAAKKEETKEVQEEIKVKAEEPKIVTKEKPLQVKTIKTASDETKNLFVKYKELFDLLTQKISNLNDKKFDNVAYAKEIKIKFINLYQYFNDFDIKTITDDVFAKIKMKTNIKELKRYCDFVDNYEEKVETIKIQDTNLKTSEKELLNKGNDKIDNINEELEFYKKIENDEQELDDEYYDNIDYDDYDEYYD